MGIKVPNSRHTMFFIYNKNGSEKYVYVTENPNPNPNPKKQTPQKQKFQVILQPRRVLF